MSAGGWLLVAIVFVGLQISCLCAHNDNGMFYFGSVFWLCLATSSVLRKLDERKRD